MQRVKRLSGRRCVPFLLIFMTIFAARAFGAAADNAGNYTPATFTNGSNGGFGFQAWNISLGAGATAALRDSKEATGDINSPNGYSFRFYGGPGGSYVDAIRPFAAPLSVGDVFSFKMAYNWDGGVRGMALLRAGGELMYLQFRGGDTLAYGWAGGPDTVLSTVYVSTAILEVAITQLADNKLEVALRRNDGWRTNLVSGSLGGPANAIKFYNGGHAGDNVNYALYVNDLVITDSATPSLSLVGQTGMPAPWTNRWLVRRGGPTVAPLNVTLASSDPSVATVPASVQIAAGNVSATVTVAGLKTGTAVISATAPGYATGSLAVAVFDVAYDDSSYYGGTWPEGSNGGAGFQPWIFYQNDGPGSGFTNYAGRFIGDSTYGDCGNVNAQPTLDAFGLYANQVGSGGNPLSEATRPFGHELAPGETVSADIGVNWRNGAKGLVFQNGNDWLLEVAVMYDDYAYCFWGLGQTQFTSLGWTYAAGTVIRVEVQRKSASLYDVRIIRLGGLTATTTVASVSFGKAPDRVRFYNFNTEPGDQNNLYFNRLAIWSGTPLTELSIAVQEGMTVGQTNKLVIRRSGSLTEALDLTLESDNPSVVTVPNTARFEEGEDAIEVDVVGVGRGTAYVTVEAEGVNAVSTDIAVYDVAYDSSSYYGPTDWVHGANRGRGFGAWILTDNHGEGAGWTNYAGAFLGDSRAGGGNVNSASNNAFGLFANQAGSGGPAPLSEATRPFLSELGVGQEVSVEFSVNYRDGSKGVKFQRGDTWLCEVAAIEHDYVFINHSAGQPAVSLGWEHAPDTVFEVTLTRLGDDVYRVHIARRGSVPESLTIEPIALGQPPDRVNFYVFNAGPGAEHDLYFNRLGINQYDLLQMEGVVNVNIGGRTMIFIRRTGNTSAPLEVTIAPDNVGVVATPATVTFGAGVAVTQFIAEGVSEAMTFIRASAPGYVAAPFLVDVFPFPEEWDNAGNYLPGIFLPTTFTNGANGGSGFGPWNFNPPGDGGAIVLRSFTVPNLMFDSANGRSWAFLGGTDLSYASAYRDLSHPLSPGDKLQFVLGVNWSGGHRGVDIQDAAGNKLFNYNLSYENVNAVSFGTNDPVDLGWGYDFNSAILVTVEQLQNNQLSVTLVRNDGKQTNVVSTDLTAPVGRVNFYNGGHEGGNWLYALYVNDLLLMRVGGGVTDGIPNTWWNRYGIPEELRVGALDLDGDGATNADEYAGDTDPLDANRSFINRILSLSGGYLLSLEIGPNTTNSRRYDVWWTTDLKANPQVWTPMGLNATAPVGGGALRLVITNQPSMRFYRTGVIIP